MSKPAISVEGLSKRYRLGSTRVDNNLTENIKACVGQVWRGVTWRGPPTAIDRSEFWALKDVSFEVQAGEVVGIIGRNGAGKSTLLKLLSRVVEPTMGRAEIHGRMGSLLEVGTGFHPELTGRENIFLNGSIIGMSHKEISRKFDEIVAFSGVEAFLDTPVKRYSSGMYVRLAFSVASHLDPEILILDEVLAVGDAEFQKKCIEKMRSVSRSGHTVLLVSHNLAQIESLCSKALTLKHGISVGFGEASQQVRQYLAGLGDGTGPTVNLRDHPNRGKDSTPMMTELVMTASSALGNVARMAGSFGFQITYRCSHRPNDLRVGIVLENAFGVKVTSISPTYEDPHLLDNPPDEGVINASVPSHNLVAGTYFINVYMQAEGLSDAVVPASELIIEADDTFGSGRIVDDSVAVTYQKSIWTKSW